MWTVNINERDDGTYDITATFREMVDNTPTGASLNYTSTIKKVDDEQFVEKCKALLAEFQEKQSVMATLKEKMEASLNS